MNLKEIKDAARKAFSDQQSQDTEGGVPDAVSFCAGFLAGARHRQDEIDKLRQALKFTTKAAVHLFQPDKPLEKGLAPFFYHTATYEGDLELIENTILAMELLKENNE